MTRRGETDLATNKNALHQAANSQSNSKEGKPERVISDRISNPLSKGFRFWAIWVLVMLCLCAGEAVLLLYLIDRTVMAFAQKRYRTQEIQQHKGASNARIIFSIPE